MSLLDEFDALVQQLAQESHEEKSVAVPCSFCDHPATMFLTHDQDRIIPGHDHSCLIPCCRECGIHIMECVEMLRGPNANSYYAQMMHAVCGEDFVCRFCNLKIDMDTAVLAQLAEV